MYAIRSYYALGFSRAAITLLFFGIGVFLGFPVFNSAFATQAIYDSSVTSGISMIDWFSNGGTNLTAVV